MSALSRIPGLIRDLKRARKLAADNGLILQVIAKDIAESSITTTTPALDNTIPLSTEGDEIVTQAITLRDTSSLVKITCTPFLSSNGNLTAAFAMFRGTTCIGATAETALSTDRHTISFVVYDAPASASALTYSVRMGVTANTGYVNRDATASLFGGAVNLNNGIILEEVAG